MTLEEIRSINRNGRWGSEVYAAINILLSLLDEREKRIGELEKKLVSSTGGGGHGCHCDLETLVDPIPDGCVLDTNSDTDCIYAVELRKMGKGKEACEYWRPVQGGELE